MEGVKSAIIPSQRTDSLFPLSIFVRTAALGDWRRGQAPLLPLSPLSALDFLAFKSRIQENRSKSTHTSLNRIK